MIEHMKREGGGAIVRRFFSRISWEAVAIVCGLLLLSLCAEYFLPRKVVVGGSLICLVLCAVLLTVVVKKRRLPFAQRYGGYVVLVLAILCLAAYAGLMFSCFDYTYINGIPVLFWLLPLLCGVAVGAFVLFKWLRKHPADQRPAWFPGLVFGALIGGIVYLLLTGCKFILPLLMELGALEGVINLVRVLCPACFAAIGAKFYKA